MRVTSPWFLFFLFFGTALVTASIGWGFTLTPQFWLLAGTSLFTVAVFWVAAFTLDDFICEMCDLPLGRYYGFLWGSLGAFVVGIVLAVLLGVRS